MSIPLIVYDHLLQLLLHLVGSLHGSGTSGGIGSLGTCLAMVALDVATAVAKG